MSKGLEIRAQIDADTVKALLLLNGGGAVALLAFLQAILDKGDEYDPLVRGVLWGLLILMLGLASAVAHNICRRKCSLHYERFQFQPPKGSFIGLTLWEPGVCAIGTLLKWGALVSFLVAGSIVSITGLVTIT